MSSPLKIARPLVRRRRGHLHRVDEAVTAAARDCVVDCGVYIDGQREPFDGGFVEAARLARRRNGFVWIGLYEPTEEQFVGIAEEFGLHELAVEDAIVAHQRPKLDKYDNTLFVTLKTVKYVEHEQLTSTSEVVHTGEVMIFVGPHFAITVRHGQHTSLGVVRSWLEERPELMQHGSAAVLYAVADHVVDAYVSVVEDIEIDVDEVEASVFAPRRSQDIERIYQLKREVLELRRAVLPLARPLRDLSERRLAGVPEEIREYFRDVADHFNQASEQIGSFDELLSSILQACIARVGMEENEDMRKISAWVAIAAVPTAMAGIYGMNFTHMPELQWTFGYPLVIAVMAVICVLLHRGFRRNGWL